MESLQTTLDHIEALLDEERSAIARADSARVMELSVEKEGAMNALLAGGIGDHPELLPQFRRMTERLRENLVLLVHARACVNDVLSTFAAGPVTYAGMPSLTPTGARPTGATLSITG